MEAKKLAIVLAIAVLLPLFLGLFVDAIYAEPKYEKYCNETYPMMYKEPISNTTCPEAYATQEAQTCINQRGQPQFKYDENNCQVFDNCDMCSLSYEKDREVYNRNVFFILAPIGLIIIILGIYLTVDYLGAGLMFAGIITMFYATIRYFSDMSKIVRALVILVELLIIMWIAYKKIEDKKKGNQTTKKTKKKKK